MIAKNDRKKPENQPVTLINLLFLFWNATLWSLLLYQKMKNESSVPGSLLCM